MSETSSFADTAYQDDLLDIKSLIGIVRRRFWSGLAAAAITLLAYVLFSAQETPVYSATSRLVLNVQRQQVFDFESVVSGMPSDAAAVNTEIEVIKSREIAGDVVDDLSLTNVPEFNPTLREPTRMERLRSSVSGFFANFLPSQVSDGEAEGLTGEASVDIDERARERAISAVLSRLDAQRVGGTYVIEISARSETPSLARDIANAYADGYLSAQLDAKFEATERANEWLNERVESLRAEVRAREQAVAEFRERNGLLDTEGATLSEQQVADINSRLAAQRAELSAASARLDSVQSQLERGVSPGTIGEILRSDVIQELRQRESTARGRLAELSSRYGPRHPQILTINREIADIEAQMEAGVERIISNLQNDVDTARERVRSLQASLAAAQSELARDNSALVRLRELEREAEASRVLFESFLSRFRQTNEAETLTSADARIVARATTPGAPATINPMVRIAIGLILAGMVAGGVMILLEMLDGGLNTEDDIERNLNLPHIASIPRLKPALLTRLSGGGKIDPVKYAVDKPMSGFSESVRSIRSAIRICGIDEKNQVVAVCSALPGEGKTTVSSVLGEISAMAGTRTIVVDCDLRRRLLSHALVPDAQGGILEYLNGDVALDSIVVRHEASGLDVLPLTEVTFTPRDVFGSQAFEGLLEELRNRYDLVVLDTPPVLAVADARSIASNADAVIITARWKKSSVTAVRKAIGELRQAGANVLGVVLNSVDLAAQARYGYDNAGYYYRSYRKYYAD